MYYRNILLALCAFLFVGLLIALMTIKVIIEKNAVEPYVISISKTDAMPVAVNSSSVKQYSDTNLTVVEYFLSQYIKTREGYNYITYQYDYNVLTKIMSSRGVYSEFYNTTAKGDGVGPSATLGNRGTIEVIIKQITTDPRTQTSAFRIAKRTITDSTQQATSHYKITMHYIFDTSNMNYRDLTLNPLGIKIDSYQVLEEKTLVDDELH